MRNPIFPIVPTAKAALILVDVQNDFLPQGSLAVPGGDQILDPLNHAIQLFSEGDLPIFATRDWHPEAHCSFEETQGIWPRHCIANTFGAAFSEKLELPETVRIVSKGTALNTDAYSGFEKTDLDRQLKDLQITELYVGGLATDYCIFNTVKDALRLGYTVYLLTDSIKGVNVKPGDERYALDQMRALGAIEINARSLKLLAPVEESMGLT